jgi:ABC-type branched-subunit amino acid transport system ATPase component
VPPVSPAKCQPMRRGADDTTTLEQEPRAGQGQPVLEAVGLCVGHSSNPVVRELNRRVHAGEVVALLGANGAGKTTTLLGLAGEILIADELSLGLAPVIVQRLIETIQTAARNGLAVLIVEQQVHTALAASDRAYLLKQGEDILEGASQALAERIDDIEAGYLSE